MICWAMNNCLHPQQPKAAVQYSLHKLIEREKERAVLIRQVNYERERESHTSLLSFTMQIDQIHYYRRDIKKNYFNSSFSKCYKTASHKKHNS